MDAQALATEAEAELGRAQTLEALEQFRVAWLGKSGRLTAELRSIGALDPSERAARGQALNRLRLSLQESLGAQLAQMRQHRFRDRFAAQAQDLTLPAQPAGYGRLHLIPSVIEEAIAIFGAMGLTVAEGPDIENDFRSFEALNIPPEHPARQMQDTFYIQSAGAVDEQAGSEDLVLRPHTSPVQVRTMLAQRPPIAIIAPGRTYRRDFDMTHSPMFHQIEGLVLAQGVTFAHLKGCLETFCQSFFEDASVQIRLRPSYFPFTEPSAEVDIAIDGSDDWLEILGCGMVHPQVLRNCGHDSETTQGFAFGVGVERLAMLKYGVRDLRQFFESDVPWLAHYGVGIWETPSLLSRLTGFRPPL